jgi:hypothetical protein
VEWIDTQGAGRRRQPRADVEVDCILTRRKGSPVTAQTLDLGLGGMRITTQRPLGVDEVLKFDIVVQGAHVDGDARVLREHGPNVYALRFETMRDVAAQRLGTLTSGWIASHS